jgi:hypothetical protein
MAEQVAASALVGLGVSLLGSDAWANKTPSILSVDPGERHCGMAEFRDGACLSAWEMSPGEAIILVRSALRRGHLEVLLVEQFRLYPWMADQQAFSSFKTVEVIGVLRYLWCEFGQDVTWVENPATIKKPTKAILQARGVRSRAKELRAGGHALDAELHGYHYLLHQQPQGGISVKAGERVVVAPGDVSRRAGRPKPTGAAGAAKAVKKATRRRAVDS